MCTGTHTNTHRHREWARERIHEAIVCFVRVYYQVCRSRQHATKNQSTKFTSHYIRLHLFGFCFTTCAPFNLVLLILSIVFSTFLPHRTILDRTQFDFFMRFCLYICIYKSVGVLLFGFLFSCLLKPLVTLN